MFNARLSTQITQLQPKLMKAPAEPVDASSRAQIRHGLQMLDIVRNQVVRSRSEAMGTNGCVGGSMGLRTKRLQRLLGIRLRRIVGLEKFISVRLRTSLSRVGALMVLPSVDRAR